MAEWVYAGDNLDAFKRQPPPANEDEAGHVLHQLILYGAIKCMTWLLRRYPSIVNVPDAHGYTPLMRAACSHRVVDGTNPKMIRILLEAGAQSSKCPGRYDECDVLWTLIGNYNYPHEMRVQAASHLIDYGSWIPYDRLPSLYALWKARFDKREARIEARKALWIALRRLRGPKEIVRMVIRSAPLSDALSWKAWSV